MRGYHRGRTPSPTSSDSSSILGSTPSTLIAEAPSSAQTHTDDADGHSSLQSISKLSSHANTDKPSSQATTCKPIQWTIYDPSQANTCKAATYVPPYQTNTCKPFSQPSSYNPFSQTKSLKLDDLEPIKQIGRGGHGQIYLVKHKDTESPLALKVIRKAHARSRSLEHAFEEQSIMKSLVGNPWFLSLKGSFQDTENFFMLTVSRSSWYLVFRNVNSFALRRNIIVAAIYSPSFGITEG